MVDLETARNVVARYVNATYHVEGDELIILDEETIENGRRFGSIREMKRVLTALLVGVFCAVAGAQVRSDRELAGLSGAVRTLRTEITEFAPEGGRGAGGRRVPVRAVTYITYFQAHNRAIMAFFDCVGKHPTLDYLRAGDHARLRAANRRQAG